jgi:ribosomal protein L7/L12
MDTATMIAASSLVVTLLLAVKVISLQRQLHLLQKQIKDGLVHDTPIVTTGNVAAPLIMNAQLQAQLRTLVENGQSIRAIKKLREATNLSLIEAKQIIDQFEIEIK